MDECYRKFVRCENGVFAVYDGTGARWSRFYKTRIGAEKALARMIN